jgi:hypothetical protein
MDLIEYEPSQDPTYRDVPLRHRTTIPVLGIPVHFLSNAPAVIALCEEAFGGWRTLDGVPELVEGPEVTVRLAVHPGAEGEAEHAEIFYRHIGNHRILIGSQGSVAFSDPMARTGVGYFTPQLVADRQQFRYAFLEALTLSILTRQDRQPFHAAAIVRDGAAVVISGPSGTGKSTLAYAAARAGMHVLGEDTVYLQSDPRFRVWGLPGYLHVPLDAAGRFPELRGAVPTLLANGKMKLAVDLRARGALPELPVVERAVLCLLRRGEGTRLVVLEPEGAADELMRSVEPGFDLFADTIRGPIVQLGSQGVWRLELAEDPMEALPLLDRLLRDL